METHDHAGQPIGTPPPPPAPPVVLDYFVVTQERTWEISGATSSGIGSNFLTIVDGEGVQWSFNLDRVIYFTAEPSR